jgi:hypothetical protein
MNGRGFARLAPLAGTAFVAIVVVVSSLLGTRDATVPVIDRRQLHAETGVAPAFEGVDDA